MIEKGFVSKVEYIKHLDGDWRTVHNLWRHIRKYMTTYPAPAAATYTKTEVDAFFEGYSGGKAQVDAGNVVGLTQGSIPFADSSGFLTEDNSNLFFDDTNNNLGLGTTSFGANMVLGMQIKTGTAPTGNVADTFAFYSDDFAAGNACPYFRTENGTVIGLNQSLLTTDAPVFATAKLSDLTDGYVPYHVSDAAGLANSPIFTDGVDIHLVGRNILLDNNENLLAKDVGGTKRNLIYMDNADGIGIGSAGADYIFFTVDGIANAMHILKTSGNIGMGEASPGEKLSLIGHLVIEGAGGWDSSGDLAKVMFGTASASAGVLGVAGKFGTGLVFGVYKASGGGIFGTHSMDAMTIEQVTGNVTVVGCVSDGSCEIMKNEDALAIIDDILKTGSGKKDKYNHERMDMREIHAKYPFMIHEQITKDEDGKEKIGYFDKLGAKSDLLYVAVHQLEEKLKKYEELIAEYQPRVDAFLEIFGV